VRTSALVVSTVLVASPTPSPKELWEAYPLKSQDSAELPASGSPSASPARAGRTGGGGRSTFLIVGAAVLAFSGGMLLGSLRGRRRAPGEAAATREAEAPRDPAAVREPAMPERAASGRFTPRREDVEVPAPALAASAAARPQAAPSAPPVPAPPSQTWAAAAPPAARPRPRPAAPSPPAVRSRPSRPAPPPIFALRIHGREARTSSGVAS
jgi:hypothetical protein